MLSICYGPICFSLAYRSLRNLHRRNGFGLLRIPIEDHTWYVVGIGPPTLDKDLIFHLNLAPLSFRRDIAMLGLIHRCALETGSSHFKTFFTASSARKWREAQAYGMDGKW